MDIIVETTGVDAYDLNGKSEGPNKTLANTTRTLLMGSTPRRPLFLHSISFE